MSGELRTAQAPEGGVPEGGAATPWYAAPGVDRAMRIVGGVVFTALGFVLGVYGVFLAPLYWHGIPVPLSLLLAVVGNPLLAWAATAVTGRRGAGIAPAAAWCAAWFPAAQATTEGDSLLASQNAAGMTWVGLATFLIGPVASAVMIYRLIIRPRPVPPGAAPPSVPPSAPPSAPPEAGPTRGSPSGPHRGSSGASPSGPHRGSPGASPSGPHRASSPSVPGRQRRR